MAASLVAEVAAWQKHDFDSSDSTLGIAASAQWLWQQHGIGGGSMAYADNHCNGNDDNNDLLLIASP